LKTEVDGRCRCASRSERDIHELDFVIKLVVSDPLVQVIVSLTIIGNRNPIALALYRVNSQLFTEDVDRRKPSLTSSQSEKGASLSL